jgi:hypothetical protein
MDPLLQRILLSFESRVREYNKTRYEGPAPQLQVTVLGQQGLLIRRESLPALTLLATTDFDALLNGQPPLGDIFKRCIRDEGLSYDEQSIYIWLPEETQYEALYESDFISVKSPQPIYLILSKARYAPEKNRQLVAEAIVQFGETLLELMDKHGVDAEFFLQEEL